MKYIFYLSLLSIFFSCSSDGENDDMTPDEGETYSISGSITGHSQILTDVHLTSSDGVDQTENTDGTYFYTFFNLTPGTYTITPEKEGLRFDPVSREVTLTDMDLSSIDFEAIITAPVAIQNMGFELFNEAVFDVSENSNNSLRLDLTENAIWYHNGQAGLVYTEFGEYFSISARVTAQKSSDHNQAPDCNVCLGGLMIRNPDNSNGENYVHIVVGVNPAGIGVETKNTTNGNSEFTPTDDDRTSYYVEVRRDGDDFIMSKKANAEDQWEEVVVYSRPDMPEVVQMGFNIYTSVSGAEVADLSVLFEEVVIDYVRIL